MPGRKLDAFMLRRERLHDDPTGDFAAPRPPGHLRQKLKRPLRGAKIRDIEGRVRADDADQGDIGKIQPLRNHLSPDKNIRLAPFERPQRFRVSALPRHRVPVHSQRPRVGKLLMHGVLYFFRSHAKRPEPQAAAFGAGVRGAAAIIAVVALQIPSGMVVGQGNIAVRAAKREAAVTAEEKRGKSPAIEKKNRLLTPFQAGR